VELAFEVTGDGPPVVLLHGLFASAASWRGVAWRLGGTHRVYSVDLRNHGRSPRSTSMAYADMADDVLRLMEREAIGRASLIGHSVGGKAAMALALMAPYAVDRLAVIDIAPAAHLDEWTQQLQAMQAALAGASARGAAQRTAPARAGAPLAELMLPRAATRNAHIDWRSHLPAIALCLPELCNFPNLLRYLRSDIALHAIVGTHSPCVNPASAEAFTPMFPNARVEVIAGAGHWVHADQPQALVDSLQRALATRPEARTHQGPSS
jgi:esterase